MVTLGLCTPSETDCSVELALCLGSSIPAIYGICSPSTSVEDHVWSSLALLPAVQERLSCLEY